MATVALTSTDGDFTKKGIDSGVFKALDIVGFKRLLKKEVETIVIKPNLSYYWSWSTGETTDPRVISSIIEYIEKKTTRNTKILVAEADASAMRTKYAFKILGYENLSKGREKHVQVELVNLSKGDIVLQNVKVAGKQFKLPMNKLLLNSDLIVNVPKLKYHRQQGMTCALKNIFGAIAKPKKLVYHRDLSAAIVGANKIVKSDLVVVDGVISLGKFPKKTGIVLASDSAFSSDCTAAKIIGSSPRKISHLALAEREKLGDPENINLISDNVTLEEAAKNFPKQNYLLQKTSWKLQLIMLKTYAQIVGDTIPPVLRE